VEEKFLKTGKKEEINKKSILVNDQNPFKRRKMENWAIDKISPLFSEEGKRRMISKKKA
jgi:hypothetical protein